MEQGDLRSTRDIREKRLQEDPEFRKYWENTALARAVALRVIGYRSEHQLTQTQLAKILGMHQPAIARLEAGEHNPSLDTLLHLSGVLGIEFLLHVAPTTRPAEWSEPREAKVFEKVRSTRTHSEATVAAS
ncbi:MAG TPA: helix-turn-helix transcriptional regulator [Chloroflexota bacterium]|nr:helix-turn-helix transcriptional regulator [Chloroflexota bacterium]